MTIPGSSALLPAFGLLMGLSAVARSETSVSQTALPDGCKVINDCHVERELRPWPRRSRNKAFSIDGKGVYYWGTKYDFDPQTFRVFKTKECSHHKQIYVLDANDVYFANPQSCGQSCSSPDYHGYYWYPIHAKEPIKFKILGGGYGVSGDQVLYIWESGMPNKADATTFQVLLCGGEFGQVVGMDQSRFYIDGKAATLKDVQALVQTIAQREAKARVGSQPTKHGE